MFDFKCDFLKTYTVLELNCSYLYIGKDVEETSTVQFYVLSQYSLEGADRTHEEPYSR
jgi:hypothetical protein